MKVGGRGGPRHVPTDLAGVCKHSLINDNTVAAADRLPPKRELENDRTMTVPTKSIKPKCWAAERLERIPSEPGSTWQWGKEERDVAKSSESCTNPTSQRFKGW